MLINISGRQHVLDFLPQSSIGAEIGVHLGDFSAQLIRRCSPQKLILIDPWKYATSDLGQHTLYGGDKYTQDILDSRFINVKNRFSKYISTGTVEIIREKSIDAAHHITNGYLDWVYIDGDHTFDAVLNDIQQYYLKVKKGGLIIGDDYSLDGWWGDDVIRAFSKCIYEYNMKIEFVIDNQICCKKT